MSVRPQEVSSISMKFGIGRRVMHAGMQYDPIEGQRHEPLKVGKSAIFNGYLLPHLQWGLASDHGFLN